MQQTHELAGCTALVTRATSGIGEATAIALAGMGAHVLVTGRNQQGGEAVVEAIRSTVGKADCVQPDLHDAASARDPARRGCRH